MPQLSQPPFREPLVDATGRLTPPWQQWVVTLQSAFVRQTLPYTVTNAGPLRTYDADAATLAELRDIVATLLDDLRQLGWVRLS